MSSSLGGRVAAQLHRRAARLFGGAKGDRTPDPYTASVVLSQLSYRPEETPHLAAEGLAVNRRTSLRNGPGPSFPYPEEVRRERFKEYYDRRTQRA